MSPPQPCGLRFIPSVSVRSMTFPEGPLNAVSGFRGKSSRYEPYPGHGRCHDSRTNIGQKIARACSMQHAKAALAQGCFSPGVPSISRLPLLGSHFPVGDLLSTIASVFLIRLRLCSGASMAISIHETANRGDTCQK